MFRSVEVLKRFWFVVFVWLDLINAVWLLSCLVKGLAFNCLEEADLLYFDNCVHVTSAPA